MKCHKDGTTMNDDSLRAPFGEFLCDYKVFMIGCFSISLGRYTTFEVEFCYLNAIEMAN